MQTQILNYTNYITTTGANTFVYPPTTVVYHWWDPTPTQLPNYEPIDFSQISIPMISSVHPELEKILKKSKKVSSKETYIDDEPPKRLINLD